MPIQVNYIGGNRYFFTFIYDYSRELCTYLIKIKDEVFEVFKKFQSMVERQNGHKVNVHKTDGGGGYVSNDFGKFYDQEGIIHGVVPPYTMCQNVVAERNNCSIINMVRCMLKGNN